jgi:hypothetical protein
MLELYVFEHQAILDIWRYEIHVPSGATLANFVTMTKWTQ